MSGNPFGNGPRARRSSLVLDAQPATALPGQGSAGGARSARRQSVGSTDTRRSSITDSSSRARETPTPQGPTLSEQPKRNESWRQRRQSLPAPSSAASASSPDLSGLTTGLVVANRRAWLGGEQLARQETPSEDGQPPFPLVAVSSSSSDGRLSLSKVNVDHNHPPPSPNFGTVVQEDEELRPDIGLRERGGNSDIGRRSAEVLLSPTFDTSHEPDSPNSGGSAEEAEVQVSQSSVGSGSRPGTPDFGSSVGGSGSGSPGRGDRHCRGVQDGPWARSTPPDFASARPLQDSPLSPDVLLQEAGRPDIGSDREAHYRALLMRRDKVLEWYHEKLLSAEDELDDARNGLRLQAADIDRNFKELLEARREIDEQKETVARARVSGSSGADKSQAFAAPAELRQQCEELEDALRDKDERLDGCYKHLLKARLQEHEAQAQASSEPDLGADPDRHHSEMPQALSSSARDELNDAKTKITAAEANAAAEFTRAEEAADEVSAARADEVKELRLRQHFKSQELASEQRLVESQARSRCVEARCRAEMESAWEEVSRLQVLQLDSASEGSGAPANQVSELQRQLLERMEANEAKHTAVLEENGGLVEEMRSMQAELARCKRLHEALADDEKDAATEVRTSRVLLQENLVQSDQLRKALAEEVQQVKVQAAAAGSAQDETLAMASDLEHAEGLASAAREEVTTLNLKLRQVSVSFTTQESFRQEATDLAERLKLEAQNRATFARDEASELSHSLQRAREQAAAAKQESSDSLAELKQASKVQTNIARDETVHISELHSELRASELLLSEARNQASEATRGSSKPETVRQPPNLGYNQELEHAKKEAAALEREAIHLAAELESTQRKAAASRSEASSLSADLDRSESRAALISNELASALASVADARSQLADARLGEWRAAEAPKALTGIRQELIHCKAQLAEAETTTEHHAGRLTAALENCEAAEARLGEAERSAADREALLRKSLGEAELSAAHHESLLREKTAEQEARMLEANAVSGVQHASLEAAVAARDDTLALLAAAEGVAARQGQLLLEAAAARKDVELRLTASKESVAQHRALELEAAAKGSHEEGLLQEVRDELAAAIQQRRAALQASERAQLERLKVQKSVPFRKCLLQNACVGVNTRLTNDVEHVAALQNYEAAEARLGEAERSAADREALLRKSLGEAELSAAHHESLLREKTAEQEARMLEANAVSGVQHASLEAAVAARDDTLALLAAAEEVAARQGQLLLEAAAARKDATPKSTDLFFPVFGIRGLPSVELPAFWGQCQDKILTQAQSKMLAQSHGSQDVELRLTASEESVAQHRALELEAAAKGSHEEGLLQEVRDELAAAIQQRRAALQASERAQLERLRVQKQLQEARASESRLEAQVSVSEQWIESQAASLAGLLARQGLSSVSLCSALPEQGNTRNELRAAVNLST
ncbi:unnamed protein product [Polarella glacialis]|uniref:Uncharacterized protein n=1 Tax=Polarella glacialis TaxID=89957 RepID=A0A813J3W8_POLGL|nr:unnamed protein product [Polarella glacialis]